MLEVLEGVTDSVATIYLIVRDRKQANDMAECAMASAKALKCSLSALQDVAKITWDAATVRPEARKCMEQNAKFMMEGMDGLINALSEIRKGLNEKDFTTAASNANVAILKILNGISCLVVLEDQLSIISIGEHAETVLEVNEELDASKSVSELEQLTGSAIEANDAFMRRVKRRIQSYHRDSFEHQELESAIEALQAAGPTHLNAVKAHLMSPAEPNTVEESTLLIENSLDRVLSLIRGDFWRNDRVLFGQCPLRPPQTAKEVRMHNFVFKVAMTGSLLHPIAVTGGGDINDALRQFGAAANDLLHVSRSFANDSPDVIKAGLIEKCCQTLTELIPNIVNSTKEVLKDRKSALAIFTLQSQVLYVRGIGMVLFTALQDALPLENCVASFVSGINRISVNFESVLKQADTSCTEVGCDILNDLLGHFLYLLDAIAHHETDKQRTESVSFVHSRLSRFRDELMVQCTGLSADSGDKKLKESLISTIESIGSTSKVLVPPHVYAYALWKNMCEDEDLLLECLLHKTPNFLSDCKNHVRAAASSLKEIMNIIDGMQGSISKMRYEVLKVSSDTASTHIGKLIEATKGALVDSGKQGVVEALREAVARSKATAEDSVSLMSPSLEEINLYWTRIRDLMISSGVSTSIPSPKDDPINALATRLLHSIPKASSSEHAKIVSLCSGIAKKLSNLAAAATGSSKFRVVEYSREISAETFELMRIAQIVDTKCRDRKRRQGVAAALSCSRFFLVMMKLSSVAYACSSVKQPLIFSLIRLCSALTMIARVGSM